MDEYASRALLERDPVAWVAQTLDEAIVWATEQARNTRRARVANLDKAVATSTCAIGHKLDWDWWATQPFYDYGLRLPHVDVHCGYCGSAYSHQRTPEVVG